MDIVDRSNFEDLYEIIWNQIQATGDGQPLETLTPRHQYAYDFVRETVEFDMAEAMSQQWATTLGDVVDYMLIGAHSDAGFASLNA